VDVAMMKEKEGKEVKKHHSFTEIDIDRCGR
jgi:hypothetical protein